jgi:serine/threonine protein kinase
MIFLICVGRRAAVKVFDLRREGAHSNLRSLTSMFEQEVAMLYRLRDAKNHVVNIYGFDFDKQNRVALIAMELGDDSLEERVKKLHFKYDVSGPISGDYISARDRKYIWIQLVKILLALHQHNVVS